MYSGSADSERLQLGSIDTGRGRILLDVEPEDDVAQCRRQRFDAYIGLSHRELVQHAIPDDHAHLVVSGNERDPVLIGKRRTVGGLHLAARELDVAFPVVGDHERAAPITHFQAHVERRVVLRLVGVRLHRKILEVDLDREVQKRRALGTQQGRERASAGHEIEGVLRRDLVAVAKPSVEVVGPHRTLGRVLDIPHHHFGPEGGRGNIVSVHGLARVERQRRSRKIGRDVVKMEECGVRLCSRLTPQKLARPVENRRVEAKNPDVVGFIEEQGKEPRKPQIRVALIEPHLGGHELVVHVEYVTTLGVSQNNHHSPAVGFPPRQRAKLLEVFIGLFEPAVVFRSELVLRRRDDGIPFSPKNLDERVALLDSLEREKDLSLPFSNDVGDVVFEPLAVFGR